MVIVGSVAAHYWNLNRRDPKDSDCFLSEGEPVPEGGVRWDYHRLPYQIYSKIACYGGIAPPDILYTIKCSHLAWDIHWEKTKLDALYMKSKGCSLLPDIYQELKLLWEKEYGDKSFLSLKKEKEYFFDDHVTYLYDHDYLHELVAYPNSPIYLSVLKDGEQVLTDKNKFDKLSFESKVRLFREEITVIACERWLLNKKNKETDSWYRAYQLSLKKTITRLTKGWATDFTIEHLDKFVVPDYSYFKHLIETLEDNMSIVDMTIFNSLLEDMKANSMDHLVLSLADGELDYLESDFEGLDWKATWDKQKEILQQYDYEHLEQEGGGEGGSEYCYGVFKLKGKEYRAEWSYYSHHGYDYDDIESTLKEVKPVEKTITVWE
jgi:hypothetical protein